MHLREAVQELLALPGSGQNQVKVVPGHAQALGVRHQAREADLPNFLFRYACIAYHMHPLPQHPLFLQQQNEEKFIHISRSSAEFVRYLDEDDLQKYLARAIKDPSNFPEEVYGALAAENFRRAAVEKRIGQPYAYPNRTDQTKKEPTP